MSGVITAPEQLAPDQLTQFLRRAGVLEQGFVASLSIRTNAAFNSAISHLDITYSPNASPRAPRTLLLKLNLPEPWAREAGAAEVAFYTEVRTRGLDLPIIVPCYNAAYDPETRDSHLLLLDVSATHEPLVTRDDLIALRGVASQEQLEAAVSAVAVVHATWWEDPSLLDGAREVSGWYGTRGRFDAHIERRQRECAEFFQGLGSDLPSELVHLYRSVLDRLPTVWDSGLGKRMTLGKNLTLVHGDCYLSQFLWPIDGTDATYLADWQGAMADLPSADLTYLLATFWTPEQRHEADRERHLLEQYLAVLARTGVMGYGWEELQWDYRLFLIFMVFHPVWDALEGAGKDYWWPKMQCLTSAYRDWACEELLA